MSQNSMLLKYIARFGIALLALVALVPVLYVAWLVAITTAETYFRIKILLAIADIAFFIGVAGSVFFLWKSRLKRAAACCLISVPSLIAILLILKAHYGPACGSDEDFEDPSAASTSNTEVVKPKKNTQSGGCDRS